MKVGQVAKRIHFFNADGAVDIVKAPRDYEIIQHAAAGDRCHGEVGTLKGAEEYARQLYERGQFNSPPSPV